MAPRFRFRDTTPMRRLAAGALVCVAVLQSSETRAADFIDWIAQPSKVVISGVEYSIVDVRAQFVQSGIQVVNAYDVQVSNSLQAPLFQNDLNILGGGTGTWNPTQ